MWRGPLKRSMKPSTPAKVAAGEARTRRISKDSSSKSKK